MSETLIIRLPAQHTDAPVQWLLTGDSASPHEARMGALLQGTLSEASALAAGRRVIVLVPGAEALQVEPVLPPLKGNTRLSQLVPYALEDQLAADVDALHFAVGKRGTRPGTPVIVVSHDAMQRWIFMLRDVGLQADALYVDTSLLPVVSDGYSVMIEGNRVSARHDEAPVATLDIEPLSEALSLLLPATDAPVTVHVAEHDYDTQQQEIESMRDRAGSMQIKLVPDVMPMLALQAVHAGGINLLQGLYAPRARVTGHSRSWGLAAATLAAALVLYVVTAGIQLLRLNKQEAALDQQISLAYGQGLPGAAPVEALQARQSFETRLQQARRSGGASGLMSGLNVLADSLRNSSDLQLDTVTFRNNSVDLRLMAPDVQALEKIRQQAQAQGMTAEIQSANPKENRIEGVIMLKSAAGAST